MAEAHCLGGCGTRPEGSAARAPFTAEQLAADFGADSALARAAIPTLYRVLVTPGDAAARTCLETWQGRLREIAGYDLEAADPRFAVLGGHYGIDQPRAAPLLFAIHSYYAIFLKLLAAATAASGLPGRDAATESPVDEAARSARLRRQMTVVEQEQGDPCSPLGIATFVHGKLFAWYLAVWNGEVADRIGGLVRTLSAYDAATLVSAPGQSRDRLKHLYQHLFPKAVRHSLGEYYTPDWLAEFTLDEVGFTGDPDRRLLDPACGSGTFLVLAIDRVKAWYARHRDGCGYDERALCRKILRNLVGFDKNPLAVMAARTNFRLALGDLLALAEPVELPIYLGDALDGSLRAAGTPGSAQSLRSFDYVVGNPPWINWEALPADYRQRTAHLFRDYQLLTLKGWKARVAAGRTDLAILFLVTSLALYVKDSGVLAFVITQSIFKSAGGGAGLRRFHLPEAPFAPLKVHDFAGVAVFPDAVTRVAVGVFQRDRSCTYPVPYFRWEPREPTRHRSALFPRTAAELPALFTRRAQQAITALPGDPQSPWLTGTPASIFAMTRMLGASAYRAREGINWGGTLGVFQLTEAQFASPDPDARPDSGPEVCTIKNDGAAGRIKVDSGTATVEAALVFPLLKGRDVQRWRAAGTRSVLIAHPPDETAAKPWPLPTMQRRYPQALAYFSRFRQPLEARKEYKRWGGVAPFYELYRIGPYTFAPFKVVFKDLTELFQCCVVATAGPRRRVVIPDYTLRMIACATADEAYFIAGLLNSRPVNVALHATAVGVQTQRYHAGDIEKLALPLYDPQHSTHVLVGELSAQCHAAAAARRPAEVAALEARLDAAVATLWALSPAELLQLQADFAALARLAKTRTVAPSAQPVE